MASTREKVYRLLELASTAGARTFREPEDTPVLWGERPLPAIGFVALEEPEKDTAEIIRQVDQADIVSPEGES